MFNELINRERLKTAIKGQRLTYTEVANVLNITRTTLCFKITGRGNRGVLPFTENEVQDLRALFGDSILNPALTNSKSKGRLPR